MKKILSLFRCLAFLPALVLGGLAIATTDALAVQTLTMKPASGMDRAVLKYGDVPADCAGALVLCPGYNQDGEGMMKDRGWQALAQKHKYVLIGLSFSSPGDYLSPSGRRGYYYTEKGSGKLLIEGVTKIAGKEVPIVLFGFSGGAHFTHRFVYRNPTKVKAWAAYSFGWGDSATSPGVKPPGIFICGSKDERLGATFDTFGSAASKGWPVCWLEVPNNDHSIDKRAAGFAREFLDAAIQFPPKGIGIVEKAPRAGGRSAVGSAKVWFPNEAVREAWRGIQPADTGKATSSGGKRSTGRR